MSQMARWSHADGESGGGFVWQMGEEESVKAITPSLAS